MMYPFSIPTGPTSFGFFGSPTGSFSCAPGTTPGQFGWNTIPSPTFGGFGGGAPTGFWPSTAGGPTQGTTPVSAYWPFAGTGVSPIAAPSAFWPQTLAGAPIGWSGIGGGTFGGLATITPTSVPSPIAPWFAQQQWCPAPANWANGINAGYGCSPIAQAPYAAFAGPGTSAWTPAPGAWTPGPWTNPTGWTTPTAYSQFPTSTVCGSVPFGTGPFIASPYGPAAPITSSVQSSYGQATSGQPIGFSHSIPVNGPTYSTPIGSTTTGPIYPAGWTPVAGYGFMPVGYGQPVPFVAAGPTGYVGPITQGPIGATATPTIGLHREAA